MSIAELSIKRPVTTIMFFVSRMNQSKVIPSLLLSSRASNPRFRVVISCHVTVAETAPGVAN